MPPDDKVILNSRDSNIPLLSITPEEQRALEKAFWDHVREKEMTLSRQASSRNKRGPSRNSRLAASLYHSHVCPWFPPQINQNHHRAFLEKTVPFLMNSTCRLVTVILCSHFWVHHEKTLSEFMDGEKHLNLSFRSIRRHVYPELPEIAKQTPLKTQRLQDTARIVCGLAGYNGKGDSELGRFFLPSRELQARLLLPTPMTAHRLLMRLCVLGMIKQLSSGQTRWQAHQEGNKPMANSYQLNFALSVQ